MHTGPAFLLKNSQILTCSGNYNQQYVDLINR
jgi:hypothetical protein